MKILVFEYITGGGFNKQELPIALASEGLLMLQALLDNLYAYPITPGNLSLSVRVMVDERLKERINLYDFEVLMITAAYDTDAEFKHAVNAADAVWPIAPEFEGILQRLCGWVEQAHKVLLTSSSMGVVVAGDKYKSYQRFKQYQIPTVPTLLLKTTDPWHDADCLQLIPEGSPVEWMIKPVDGVGCIDSYLLTQSGAFKSLSIKIDHAIIQPHLYGKKTSLSCLFKAGRAWLLSVNEQHFELIDQQYHLTAITVNQSVDHTPYQALVDAVARAFTELWGYVGLDLIETPEALRVLEINPRLTSSFVGLKAACGLNVAALVLQLLTGDPVLTGTDQHALRIKVSHDAAE